MLNKAELIGNLGSDPEIRNTNNGTQVASFSLATSESYKDKTTGEKKTITDWHNVVVWGSLAEIAGKYLKKGSKAYIEGRIKTRSYDAKDGGKRYVTEIVGDKLLLLGEKPTAAQENSTEVPGMAQPTAEPYSGSSTVFTGSSDDLPF